jgi:amino acid adenylation domain-containing protein
MSTGTPDTETKRAIVAERLRQAALRQEPAPLSFAQQRLWFLDQLEPNSPLYNIGVVARLTGALHPEALGRALNTIVTRHEALRTRFICPNETPEQAIDSEVNLTLEFVDLSSIPRPEREQESKRLISVEVNRPFNLGTDRLVRARLHCLSAMEHEFILILHHIVADEWSLRILFRELETLYRKEVSGRPAQMPELPIQYSDFAVWQRDSLQGETLGKLLRYWRKQLGGKPPVTELPTDRPRRLSPTFRGGHISRSLDPGLARNIKQLASDQEATPFMLLLSAFKVLLHRYTQQADLIVGSPIAGRTRIETEPLIGFFVNTLPLRTSLADDPTFDEVLRRVQETTLGAYAHQDLPFERMVEELQPERSLNHMPFTKVMFVLQNNCLEEFAIDDLKVELDQVTSDLAKFELTLVIKETGRGLLAHAEYNSDLFDETTIIRFLNHYETLLRGIISAPLQRISQLPMLTPQEKRQLLYEWNGTKTNYPADACVHRLFEAQAALRPNAIAVSSDGKTITYRELNQRANQLAQYLTRWEVGTETLVGVSLEHPIDLVVAFLAALKTGGAYVPLDLEYPKERLAFMLNDTRAPVLLTQQSLVDKLPRTNARIVCVDRDWEAIALESSENLSVVGCPEALAYLMYTSGSTGRPKGVAVSHRGIVRLVLNTNYISLDHTNRIAQVSNISFDAATFELWGALLNGGQLIGFSREEILSPELFARNLRRHGITAMFLTSALFNQIAAEVPGAFESLRTLIIGGEALDPKSIRSVLHDRPPQRLLNGYGPTENTTFTCCYLIRELPENAVNVPIGKAIANTEVYLLDPYGNPVPIGVPGELHIGGDGLAKGYFGQPALTAEKFIRHPFCPNDEVKNLYRTGDLARYLPDGNIEFLGRIDHQVKLRGFRIELGEIESRLSQHAGVRECVVVLHRQASGEKQLVAYFTPRAQPAPSASVLREFLALQLPSYMLPSSFVQMSALPLTSNGKIDRQSLAGIVPERPKLTQEYTVASDPVELQLISIWEKVLAVRPIGIRDRFFDLGGHSLLAVRVIGEIEKAFGKKLRLATIFQAPTIHQLAAILRDEIMEASATADSSLVEIQGEGSRPPLFLVHGAGGGMFWGYVNLSRHLGPEQPVYAFKSRGLDGGRETERIEEMAEHYIRDLRRLQPHGPYFLGGYCFGGNVAYEMACQLAAQQEPVALLALFNCAAPNSGYTRLEYTLRWLFRFTRNLFYLGSYFFQWNPRQRREFFRWKWSLLKKRLTVPGAARRREFSQVEAGDLVDLSSFSGDQRRTWEAHIRALVAFHPKAYDGQVHLFRSPGHPLLCSFEPTYGWAEFARGGVNVAVLPGAHEKILEEPCVEVLGRELAQSLTVQQAAVLSTPSFTDEETCLSYWKRQLANSPTLLELPSDRSRPAHFNFKPDCLSVHLSKSLTNGIEELAQQTREGIFPVLMAAFAALLHRYSAIEHVVVGTSAGHHRSGSSAGGQLTVLPIRCDLTGNADFLEVIGRVQAVFNEALRHRSIPFARIVQLVCGDQPNTSYAPLFQSMLTVSEPPGEETAIPLDADLELLNQLDLRLWLTSSAGELRGSIYYNPLLFDSSRIERLIEHFRSLLTAAVANPRCRIWELPLMPAAEHDRVLVEWNRTETTDPIQKTLVELFDEQAARTPDSVALVDGSSRLTYRELHTRTNQIALQLVGFGVTRETLVGVFHQRTAQMIAAMLGILKAGAAYVPLDPVYPKQRLQAILEDAKPRVVLTQQKLLGLLPSTQAKALCLEEIPGPEDVACPGNETSADTGPGNLAYVIYTSGSTGKPKGVALEHRGAVALVYWAKRLFARDELSGVLASTSICFDLSVFEIFVPLCNGGKVILAENALALANLPAAPEVTLINTVPSAMKELLRARAVPSSVTVVNLAGEPLATELVDQIYRSTAVNKVYDLYGPTETTTYSTGSLRQAGAPATIGRPLSNEQVYLLDKHLQPVPTGIPGELCIGGVGLARGYLNQPELTRQKFIPDPFKSGGRLYRTGDLARWSSDGCLEYLGRIDQQVKIRGFRIELGEIEALLRNHPGIREALVLAREDHPGDKRLVAYVVSRIDGTPTADELKSALQEKLPHYMVPSTFVFLQEIPLTPNGKVDRKALPAPKRDIAVCSSNIAPAMS